MGRWQPDARGRLGKAAIELYDERGYEQTTVAEIAERAGLTARTFFRYFTDKREVLFAGSDALGAELVRVVDAAPATDDALTVVAAALTRVAVLIGDDHAFSARRQAIISANSDLRGRELTKLASWSRTLSDGLRRRGVQEPAASLAAETGVVVFRVAFDQWLAGPARAQLTESVYESFAQLRAVLGAGTARADQ
ncbi:TetR family transcriptional regulator [Jatrophihabitans telluris]|uniref:TetR family transcriptional regulator n=1 Tax=Jatrophihabitans telluris TaxID=2038343 RepID=A0ABY4QYD8_9ACTN|nr:TetR family transcriptional regulator [Jatrophihabitans telluris]UQX88691.1 TetR family transcriptional regulator [Jatrophihabitans telluris]